MNKTYLDVFERLFLIEHLPEPMTRSDSHLQLFDNYLENTRLRLRSVRVPETKQWSWMLQQRLAASDDRRHWKLAEIHLNEAEYHRFEQFEGREIRKNRHFFDLDGRAIEIDLFLGSLWGLNLAKVTFDSVEEMQAFEMPPFMVLEVTASDFFRGENLVGKSFADVQEEVARLAGNSHLRDAPERELAKENE